MRFELRLEFDTFSHPKTGRRGIMSDWSKKAAQQVQMNREAKLVGDKKALQDTDICKRRAPELWKKLADMFQQKCTEFNSEPGMSNTLYFSDDRPSEFSISLGRTGKTFKGDFDSTNQRFNFVSSTWTPARFILEVRVWPGNSEADIVNVEAGPIDLESFVNSHLESLLGIG
jgi:hypothetical protein